ncbi:MAG TPA: TIGR03086 family metal-binding protein [Micromonospora sp.]
MELLEAYRRSLAEFTDRVDQVGPDQWQAPTPCSDWDVRTLVNHVVTESRWSVPLLAGSTIAEVGDRFTGDQLGADPASAAHDAAAAAELAAARPGVPDTTVHLSAGDTPAREYLHQLLAEHLVHGWDLAMAIGASPRLDEDAVRVCARWFADKAQGYRQQGMVSAQVAVPPDATESDRLVAAFGRAPRWRPPRG